MSMTVLFLCLVGAAASFMSFWFAHRIQTKTTKRKMYALAVILLVTTIASGGVSHWSNMETRRQIHRAQEEAAAAAVQAAEANTQITEIRTPRRMTPETNDMLVARLKPYAGQKYDMKVFRDEDSLELAKSFQTIFEEAGWVYTNVYPRQGTRHSETDELGVWTISGNERTGRTSEAKSALDDALHEAGLYDDSNLLRAMNCVEATGPIEIGTKLTRIPCSESEIRITGVDFTVHDDVIREDTLVLHVGKQRL